MRFSWIWKRPEPEPAPEPIGVTTPTYNEVSPKFDDDLFSVVDRFRELFSRHPRELSRLRVVFQIKTRGALDKMFVQLPPNHVVILNHDASNPTIHFVAPAFEAEEEIITYGVAVIDEFGFAIGRKVTPWAGGAQTLSAGDRLKVDYTFGISEL